MFVITLLVFSAWIKLVSAEFYPLFQEGTPWSTYYAKTEQDCSEEGKLRHFPWLYELDNNSERTVGAPVNFTVTYIEREALEMGGSKWVYYPGVYLEFYPPCDGLENFRGYELSMDKNHGTFCVVFDFTHVTWSPDKKIEFELFPLSGLTHFRLGLWSLPKYRYDQRTDVHSVVTGQFGAYRENNEVPDPAEWYPQISYDILIEGLRRSLEVVFSRPPLQYEFRRFEIALFLEQEHVEVQVNTTTEFAYLFNDVDPGRYKVMVRPVDEFFSVTGKCLCHLASGACSNCLSTETETFTIS